MTSPAKNVKQLLIIDSQIKNWQSLVSNVTDAVILVLDSASDGLTQIAQAITDYSGLDAIHIISHGSVGSLLLGSATVNSDNLNDYASQLALIGHALKDTGDLLLYGCDVAQGETGSAFINQFAALTGADVAASDNLTGVTALGGDWVLEKMVGTIETATLQSSYSDVLVLPTASQIFNSLLMPEEKLVAGGEQAGMIRTMADFAKAAYHLESSENKVINDISPNADAAATGLTAQGWTALNLHPTLSATLVVAGQTITNGMFNDGFYINGNAAACVERCGDAIVLSFRGTNDYAGKGSFIPNQNDPNDVARPDYDQWTDMPSYYALLSPLISAFDAYVANANNGISKVYVTGHSMGGAMALEYMSHHSGSQYQAITFAASPFGDTFFFVPFRKDYASDSRITQIEILRDTVPMAFDIPNALGDTNLRPGHLIDFGGIQTLDAPDNIVKAGGLVDYWGRTANHSMDYYRQITDSVDADSWTRILAGTGTQTVLLGGQQILGTSDFIVDGQLSGTNTSVNNGSEYLASVDFKTIYGGKGDDTLVAGTNATLLLGGIGSDTLVGKSGDDTLNGGTGIDSMAGGLGNDTYYVDNTGDVITENVGAGTDTVYSKASSYTLTANVENLILIGNAAINGGGNALNNQLTGNNADNVLSGGSGVDTMTGGLGNDSYGVDNTNDVVVENAGAGTDTVFSRAATYTLAANVENLILTGSAAINGGGNGLNNQLTGNSADNVLSGGGGVDTMTGGLGNDTYSVDNTGDVVVENVDEGTDTVYSIDSSYSLGLNVENLILIGAIAINGMGNALNNQLTGNSADNVLNGRAGVDTMTGGLGNDTYIVNDTNDVVVENVGEGTDTVYSIDSSYTLGLNVENLILTGTAAINGGGNALNNQLMGNSADNILSGGGGVDTMTGGLGNDSYSVDNSSDVVVENVGEGTDTVFSRASSYTLAANVENLILTGSTAINGTGNALNNQLTGNSANNTLVGGEGADILIGGLGKDTYDLTESNPKIDTLSIATGDSLTSSYDVANGFKLGTGTINIIGVDRLDLASTVIATNAAAVNGSDSGAILSHSINNGIISFDNIDSYTTPLAITAANLADTLGYLQANITGSNTVAFVSEGNTFVFQDGGVQDTLVELIGVTAQSVNTSGLATNAVWII